MNESGIRSKASMLPCIVPKGRGRRDFTGTVALLPLVFAISTTPCTQYRSSRVSVMNGEDI